MLKESPARCDGGPLIELDGKMSFENIRKMADAGADVTVAGTSCLYRNARTLEAALEELIGFADACAFSAQGRIPPQFCRRRERLNDVLRAGH